MNKKKIEYWKKRCRLAEGLIFEIYADAKITKDEIKAYSDWVDFRNDNLWWKRYFIK